MRVAVVPAIFVTTLRLAAQDPEVLPEVNPTPPAEAPLPIGPVPVPEGINLFPGDPTAGNFGIPKNIQIRDEGPSVVYDAQTAVAQFSGPFYADTDNGMKLRSDKARWEGKEMKFYVDGSVKLTTEDGMEVYADHAIADTKSETVTMTGNVSVYRGSLLQRGEQVIYYWGQEKFDATGLRAGVDPLLLEAGQFTIEERNGKQVYVGRDAGVTTHDVENPGFWLRAKETTVYPDDKVTFKNLRLYAGDTPIFWLPYLSQPLDTDLGYHFVPGARSNWGAFLLNSYGIMLGGRPNPETGENEDAWLLSRWHFDLRTRRGVGTGVDLTDKRLEDNPNLTGLSLYYTNDLNPDISRTGITRGFVNEDRYRLALQHRVPLELEKDAEWRFDANLNILSDNYYLEDFNPDLFRSDPNPDNTIGLFRRDEGTLFSLFGRVRPNEFYRSDTRLPEIAMDFARRPLFNLPILHEGSVSFSVIEEEIGSASMSAIRPLLTLPAGDPLVPVLLSQLPAYERQLIQQIRSLPPGSPAIPGLATQLFNPGYNRFHTYQEISMPMNVGGWLSLTPEMGLGYSRYSDVNGAAKSVDRTHMHAGMEASLKFSKNLGDIENRRLGLDGVLHVLQPYARFSYISTDDLDPLFPSVDRETFSTRPQPLSVPNFTAIDSLRDWSIVRLGMRNKLITKRDGQSFDWLAMDTYFDAFITDPDYNRNFSNLYNDLKWNPLPWFGMNLETQFPVIDDGSGFSEVAARANFMPNPNLEFSIGHRLLDNHPVLTDSQRLDLRTYARLNDKWGVGAFQLWELDDGTLEVQQYTIHRDFNSWVASMGITRRDNRLEDEFGVIFSFTLKDFPSASVPFKLDAQGN
ncbi:LPS assembly protein LptD [Luteolibacter arcticus]|uniref:LPS assembly protein LptD n=1 Tax=Luteolibacter arcticus TaxID=1581411 RepID=A0ABT3GDA1_9BACT|nr:LPS assembly protein LptD [Luteolibacter arcticus]MCW1921275.1 LPS assembly protein LptD [Luteolibacter arcticus]